MNESLRMPDEIPMNESLFGPQARGGGMQQQHPPPTLPALRPQAAPPPLMLPPAPPQPAPRRYVPPAPPQPAPRRYVPPAPPQPAPVQATHHNAWSIVLGFLSIVLLLSAIGGALVYAGILPLHATGGLHTSTPSTVSSVPAFLPAHAVLALHDPLQNNGLGYQWLSHRNSYGICAFEQGGYDVSVNGSAGVLFHACLIQNQQIDFSNFAYQATITLQSGNCGGLIFRSHDPHLYYFDVCTDGTYNVVAYTSDSSSVKHLAHANTTALSTGHPTQLAVVASGSSLTFYMNGQKVTTLHDTTYSDGQIGVLVANTRMGVATTTKALFKDAQVWTF